MLLTCREGRSDRNGRVFLRDGKAVCFPVPLRLTFSEKYGILLKYSSRRGNKTKYAVHGKTEKKFFAAWGVALPYLFLRLFNQTIKNPAASYRVAFETELIENSSALVRLGRPVRMTFFSDGFPVFLGRHSRVAHKIFIEILFCPESHLRADGLKGQRAFFDQKLGLHHAVIIEIFQHSAVKFLFEKAI